MYILIFEDGEVKSTDTLSDGEFSAAAEGLIDIIDIRDAAKPMQYIRKGVDPWQELERV